MNDENFTDFINLAQLHPEYLEKIIENQELNDNTIYYMINMADENASTKVTPNQLEKTIERMQECNTMSRWLILQKYNTKSLVKTNLCKNRFCSNCKKVRQIKYLAKYTPILNEFDDDLYHLTLTIPNVSGEDLEENLNKMSKKFKYLIEYISGKRKIKGLNFDYFGYEGAVRALEVTLNSSLDKKYHPHYHVALVLKNYKMPPKRIKNPYSYSNSSRDINLFNRDEILIQKIWRLLYEDIRVTKQSINDLDVGYSCIMKKFNPGEYQELFKYLLKGTNENGELITEKEFRVLHNSLYDRRQIVGYGCLIHIKDDENFELISEEYKSNIEKMEYNQLKEYEKSKNENAKPVNIYESPQVTLKNKNYVFTSKTAYLVKKLNLKIDIDKK